MEFLPTTGRRFSFAAVIKSLAEQMLRERATFPDHWCVLEQLEKRFDTLCDSYEKLKISRMDYIHVEYGWQGPWPPDRTLYRPWIENPSYWLGPKDLAKPHLNDSWEYDVE